jgi:hypothetical protein
MCKKEKEQTTTPVSLGVVCCRVYLFISMLMSSSAQNANIAETYLLV